MYQNPNFGTPFMVGQDEANQPISAWGYLRYELMFMIPVVGFFYALTCAGSHKNQNVRNFARSYFCLLGMAVLAFILICAPVGAAFILDRIF